MKNKRFSAFPAARSDRAPLTTSFMELLKVITRLTKDDAVVLEIVKRIFHSHRVRFTRTLAPVQLINGNVSRHAARGARIARSEA